MKYCMECGTKLEDKFLKNEGMIPWCRTCQAYRFPVFSTAVSMEVLNPDRDKILLIKQYGKDRYILVAGYVNKGENAEDTVVREVKEELGLTVTDLHFEKSQYYGPSNTLMLNFSCVVDSESLAHISEEEIDFCRWFSFEEAAANIAPGSLASRFLNRFIARSAEPSSMEPVSTESVSTEPASTEPVSMEFASTESASTEPVSMESASTESASTEPVSTESASTDASAGPAMMSDAHGE